MSFVKILEKNDLVITAPHCTSFRKVCDLDLCVEDHYACYLLVLMFRPYKPLKYILGLKDAVSLMFHWSSARLYLNSSPPGQNGRHFADDIFRCVFVNEKSCILIRISLNFVPKGPIDNNPALVQIMSVHYLNQCLLDSLMHICITGGGMS